MKMHKQNVNVIQTMEYCSEVKVNYIDIYADMDQFQTS